MGFPLKSNRMTNMSSEVLLGPSSHSESSEISRDRPSDHQTIRISVPILEGIENKLSVQDLGNIYAEMRLNNHSTAEIEEFKKNQTIMLVPAQSPKFKMNWIALLSTIVVCSIGGAIGYGIMYYVDHHTSLKLTNRKLGLHIPKIGNNVENDKDLKLIISKLDEGPNWDEISNVLEETRKLQEQIQKTVNNVHEQFLPEIDEPLRYEERILKKAEEFRNKLKDEAPRLAGTKFIQ